MTRTSYVAFTVALVLATSCASEDYRDDANTLVELPAGYARAPQGAEAEGWCGDFGSQELRTLVDGALQDNLDVQSAWARLEAAEAAARGAEAGYWPTVSVDASAGRAKSLAPPPVGTSEDNQFRLSGAAGYEIDVWGRVGNLSSAADADAAASALDVESLSISIAAQVANTWLEIAHQRQRIDLLTKQIATSEAFLELTLARLAQGGSSALDVTQQRQQLESLNGQLALAQGAEEAALRQLAVLMGASSAAPSLATARALPELPAVPQTGVPADLVRSRPDLKAALARLDAADYRTKVAARAWLPSLRLSATAFVQATEVADLFEEILWSVTGLVSQNVVDGGRRSAELDASEARARAQLYAYGQSLLRALAEVEDALVREESQTRFAVSLGKQKEQAELALQIARDRYRSGGIDYLRVLQILQSLQALEQSELGAKRVQFTHRVQLCRALGGTGLTMPRRPTTEGPVADARGGSK